MERQEAVEAIAAKVKALSKAEIDETTLAFATEKLVADILDYCHRDDFPEALVYTVTDLVLKRLQDESNAEEYGTTPLSSLEMGDTTFNFSVSNVSTSGLLSDADFDSIKPKLNLYRRVVSHA